MTIETEVLWLDEHRVVTFHELLELSGLSAHELEELVHGGAIRARGGPGITSEFSARMVTVARKASRLRDELELDVAGLGVVLRLLERVHELESEIARLRALRARS
jgi:chaperone modulatory protein CbpM